MANQFVTFIDLATDRDVTIAVSQVRCVKEMPEQGGTVIEFDADHSVHVRASFDQVQEALGIKI